MADHTEDAGGVHGWCADALTPVRHAFEQNFLDHGERGAALVVTLGDQVVVDLWGGWADADCTHPWERDTLVNVFSVGKGMLATSLTRLIGDGLIDPSAPVVDLWPEFAATGSVSKRRITVAQLLSHQGGLPAIAEPLAEGSMFDWDRMVLALERQDPWWSPGDGHGYHVNTFGFLGGELVRRATGITPGTFFRESIAVPLGADVHVGLAEHHDHRVAHVDWGETHRPSIDQVTMAGLTDDQRLTFLTYFNPPEASGIDVVNTRAWRAAEIPSTNTHASAAGVARVYQALANGGAVDGVSIVDRRAIAVVTAPFSVGEDLVLHRPSRFGLGFQLTQPERRLGSGPRAFGHFGAGGSLGFCDPDRGLALGYVMNKMGPRWRNERNNNLLTALEASLGT